MLKMRRVGVLVAVAGLLMGVGSVSAGSGVEGAQAAKAAPAAAKRPRIGVSVPAADHGWTAGVGWWAKRAMELHPEVDWVYSTAADPEKQIASIEDMMAKKIDGLVILCTESAPLTPTAKKAKEAGVFIVNVDRGFLEPVADVFIEGDNKALGRKSAEFVVKKLNGKGNIVVLTGIPCTVDTDRVNAAMEVFKANPGIKVLDTQPAMWNREKGLAVMENMLNKHKKIDAVWAQDDDILLGAMQAVKEAGREKEMWILGGAGMKDVVKMVMEKNPMVPADITYPPSMIATGIHLAASAMRDGKVEKVKEFIPKHLVMDVELVTPENAKEYYFAESVY